MTTQTITRTKISTDTKLEPPKDYNVIFMDDEVTPVDFVKICLIYIFDYSETDAFEKVMEINRDGKGVVATLPYEIAEQKGVEVKKKADESGFPLDVKIMPV